jgi:hypothetical protein
MTRWVHRSFVATWALSPIFVQHHVWYPRSRGCSLRDNKRSEAEPGRLQGSPLPTEDDPHMGAVVRGVPAELSPTRAGSKLVGLSSLCEGHHNSDALRGRTGFPQTWPLAKATNAASCSGGEAQMPSGPEGASRLGLFALVTVARQASCIYPHAGGTRPCAALCSLSMRHLPAHCPKMSGMFP